MVTSTQGEGKVQSYCVSREELDLFVGQHLCLQQQTECQVFGWMLGKQQAKDRLVSLLIKLTGKGKQA